MKRPITVIGSINMDVIVNVPDHPKAGQTVIGSQVHYFPGGKGANQAVAASRLGGRVSMVGKVGDDVFGSQLLEFLKKESLNTTLVFTSDSLSSGTALITVNSSGENTVVVVPSSNFDITEDEVSKIQFKKDEIVLAQLETPIDIVAELFDRAKKSGATTILNAAPAQYIEPEFLNHIDYLIVNETELLFYSPETEMPKHHEEIAAMARKLRVKTDQVILVTLGAQGALAVIRDETYYVSGHTVEVVDTTGAGDCFVAAFAVGLSEDSSLHSSLLFANAAASLAVQQLGASFSLPHRVEVDNAMT